MVPFGILYAVQLPVIDSHFHTPASGNTALATRDSDHTMSRVEGADNGTRCSPLPSPRQAHLQRRQAYALLFAKRYVQVYLNFAGKSYFC